MQMKYLGLLAVTMLMACLSYAQAGHIGLFGGPAAYSGDLSTGIFPRKITNGAIGLSYSFDLSDKFLLRAGYTYSIVGGADRYNRKPTLSLRNLSFETRINEFSLTGEYYFKNLYQDPFSLYVIGGAALFQFNPYTYDQNGQKVYLQPLSTEGQGLPQYPDRKPYKLTQPALVFGGGIKYVFSNRIRVGLESSIRKLFTEYLDDVSTNYIDHDALLDARGPLAVELAYRGDEIEGASPFYPGEGDKRGNPKSKDYYYFAGLHVTYSLGGKKPPTGCPVNVY